MTSFIALITIFIIVSNEGNQYQYMLVAKQVKINPCIDPAEKKKKKDADRQQKVKSECEGSPSLSCPAGIAALSKLGVISNGMRLMTMWEVDRQKHSGRQKIDNNR